MQIFERVAGALGRCAGRDPERLEGAGLLVEGCDRVAFGLARGDLLELPAGEDFPDLAADFGLGRGVGRGLRGRGLAGGCGRARDRRGRCRACGRGSGFGRCGRPGDGSRCRLGRCDGTRDGCGRCRSGRGRRAGRRRRSVSGRGRRLRRGLCRGGSGGRCRSRLRRGGLDLRGGSGRRKRRDVAARLQSGAGVWKRAAEPQAGVGRHDRRRRLRHAARRAVVALCGSGGRCLRCGTCGRRKDQRQRGAGQNVHSCAAHRRVLHMPCLGRKVLRVNEGANGAAPRCKAGHSQLIAAASTQWRFES